MPISDATTIHSLPHLPPAPHPLSLSAIFWVVPLSYWLQLQHSTSNEYLVSFSIRLPCGSRVSQEPSAPLIWSISSSSLLWSQPTLRRWLLKASELRTTSFNTWSASYRRTCRWWDKTPSWAASELMNEKRICFVVAELVRICEISYLNSCLQRQSLYGYQKKKGGEG